MRHLVILAAALLSVPAFAQSDSADDFQFRADVQFEAQVARDRYGAPNPDFERPAITFRNGDPYTIPTQSGAVLKLVRISDNEWVDGSGVEKRFSASDDHACANVVERMQSARQVAISADALSVNERYVPAYRVVRRCFHLKVGTESDYLAAELNEQGRVLRAGDSLEPFRGPYAIGSAGTDTAVNRYFLPTWRSHFSGVEQASTESGMSDPVLIHAVDAQFTPQARANRISGTAAVALVIDPAGTPRDVHIVRSLGYGLDESAVAAVSQYRFRPSIVNGSPVSKQITVQVNFHYGG